MGGDFYGDPYVAQVLDVITHPCIAGAELRPSVCIECWHPSNGLTMFL